MLKMLSYAQIEQIEKKVNSKLKDLFYIQDQKEDDLNQIEAYNIVLETLENLGFKINTDRKGEMILKFVDIWNYETRLHIYIKKCDLLNLEDKSNVLYRKSINYKYLLKKCDFENDEVVRSWYISIV